MYRQPAPKMGFSVTSFVVVAAVEEAMFGGLPLTHFTNPEDAAQSSSASNPTLKPAHNLCSAWKHGPEPNSQTSVLHPMKVVVVVVVVRVVVMVVVDAVVVEINSVNSGGHTPVSGTTAVHTPVRSFLHGPFDPYKQSGCNPSLVVVVNVDSISPSPTSGRTPFTHSTNPAPHASVPKVFGRSRFLFAQMFNVS